MNALQEELETYARQEEDLKKSAPGKFVVIKHSEVIGTFDTLDAALTEATRRFGLEPYMVRQIGSQVETLKIPAFTLGLIGAHH
jgi:hypothetical protein